MATPDEDAQHICDAAHDQQHKHEQGQALCRAPPGILEDLWNPSS